MFGDDWSNADPSASGLAAPPSPKKARDGGRAMGQRAETITPTTSAWAAIASIELVTVSNIRMGWSPMPEKYPACATW
jgi:hypothetical protein